MPLQIASCVAHRPSVEGALVGAREGLTRTFPEGYTQVLFSGTCGEVVEAGRGRRVKGGDRTYPAGLAEPALKQRVEGHRVFPTTGQTAVCNKDTRSS